MGEARIFALTASIKNKKEMPKVLDISKLFSQRLRRLLFFCRGEAPFDDSAPCAVSAA